MSLAVRGSSCCHFFRSNSPRSRNRIAIGKHTACGRCRQRHVIAVLGTDDMGPLSNWPGTFLGKPSLFLASAQRRSAWASISGQPDRRCIRYHRDLDGWKTCLVAAGNTTALRLHLVLTLMVRRCDIYCKPPARPGPNTSPFCRKKTVDQYVTIGIVT